MDFFRSWSMSPLEVKTMIVMFQEHRFKMRQRILFAKQAPDAVSAIRIAIVELNGLQFSKFFNQSFVDDEMLVAVLSW